MRLSDIGEVGLIQRIASRLKFRHTRTVLGIGDDAGVIRVDGSKFLIVTTDMLVEGTHFIWGKIPPHDLGYKSLAVNLSDIAAMGGKPLHALVALGLPSHLQVEDIDAFYEGIRELAWQYEVDVLGGDITASPRGLVVSLTVLGEVDPAILITQSGAVEGDLVAVTGDLGGSAAGLALLLDNLPGLDPSVSRLALEKHLRPRPRVEIGQALSATGRVHAMKDVSDGLAKELNTMACASGKMIRVRACDIPVSPAAVAVAPLISQNPLSMALRGGEDYELVFTFDRKAWDFIRTACDGLGVPVHVIGEVMTGEGVFIEDSGVTTRLDPEGYAHF